MHLEPAQCSAIVHGSASRGGSLHLVRRSAAGSLDSPGAVRAAGIEPGDPEGVWRVSVCSALPGLGARTAAFSSISACERLRFVPPRRNQRVASPARSAANRTDLPRRLDMAWALVRGNVIAPSHPAERSAGSDAAPLSWVRPPGPSATSRAVALLSASGGGEARCARLSRDPLTRGSRRGDVRPAARGRGSLQRHDRVDVDRKSVV